MRQARIAAQQLAGLHIALPGLFLVGHIAGAVGGRHAVFVDELARIGVLVAEAGLDVIEHRRAQIAPLTRPAAARALHVRRCAGINHGGGCGDGRRGACGVELVVGLFVDMLHRERVLLVGIGAHDDLAQHRGVLVALRVGRRAARILRVDIPHVLELVAAAQVDT